MASCAERGKTKGLKEDLERGDHSVTDLGRDRRRLWVTIEEEAHVLSVSDNLDIRVVPSERWGTRKKNSLRQKEG